MQALAQNVTVIPARKRVGSQRTAAQVQKIRVAAYCRVSKDSEEQETSYEAQVQHYTDYIRSRPDWEFVEIYADDGISGTNTRKREEFNRMIADCEAGKIDMVITKSISRFSRNTLDCLKYTRKLKALNIAVFFEKENINTLDLPYLCKVIGNLSGVPIRIFQGEKRIFYHCVVSLPKDPMEIYREEIRGVATHIGYFMTGRFHYYGIVNSGDTKIVIGPSKQVPGSDQELRELGFQADVPSEDMDEFVEGMKSIVCMPLESIMQMLCTINYILNEEKLELEDITIYESEQNSLKELLERQRSDRVLSHGVCADAPQIHEHNTYNQEQQMLRLVRKGDTASLRQWIASAPAIRGGMLASDQLRQMKNTFVVTATLVSRAAIQSGLSTEDSFSLSDAYSP